MDTKLKSRYSHHVTLQENYAPVTEELTVVDLLVTYGTLSAGLRGTLYRNGQNLQFPPLGTRHHRWRTSTNPYSFRAERRPQKEAGLSL
ncbi:hypothetical protein [Paraburkholderia bannensis]|uniref:hypothetical protein n=1 Tax=Paraburkholderia bannensis TaxID=765414 RepID=UPI002AB0C764|nr:hypothetical protein [Paraburkholderia bannensis]